MKRAYKMGSHSMPGAGLQKSLKITVCSAAAFLSEISAAVCVKSADEILKLYDLHHK